jgi:thioredoxin-related protein
MNYKFILSLITIIFISFTSMAIAGDEASELKQVDKEEKALLEMFKEECAKAEKCDENGTKESK